MWPPWRRSSCSEVTCRACASRPSSRAVRRALLHQAGRHARAPRGAHLSPGDRAGAGAGNQLHHLIPDSIAQHHPLIRRALERIEGYTIDRGTNILDMPVGKNAEGRIVHLGSHPEYNKYVISNLNGAVNRLGPLPQIAPKVLEDAILKVEDALRKAIESGNLPPKVLKELVEDAIIVGKKLAMLELPRHEERYTA